jgi:hypothetical protein
MRRDDPKKSPTKPPRIPLRPNLKNRLNQFDHIPLQAADLPTGFDSASRRVVRLAESAEKSWDTAVGEPEPGEIRVNGF